MKSLLSLLFLLVYQLGGAQQNDIMVMRKTCDSADIVVFQSGYKLSKEEMTSLAVLDHAPAFYDTVTVLDLDTALVKEIEDTLESVLRGAFAERVGLYAGPDIIRNLQMYSRQYIYYKTNTTQPRILINFAFTFGEQSLPDMTGVFLIHDGGSAYWRIMYDIDKRTFFGFDVNGIG